MEMFEMKEFIKSDKKHYFIFVGIILIMSLFLSFVGLTTSAYAAESVSLTGSGQNVTFYETLDPVQVDSNITLTGETFDGAKVSISEGFISGSDELLFINQNGIVGSYDATNGILSLKGTASAQDYQAAFRSVTFRNLNGSSYSNASQKKITFSIGESTLYNSDTGHFYEFVEANSINWTAAKNAAESKSYYGLKGYLATITSSSENSFIAQKLKGFGWIGASDAATEDTWKWVTGPEAGTSFYQETSYSEWHQSWWGSWYYHTHQSINTFGQFNNWSPGEPNDYGYGEDYAHFYSDGTWNDFPLQNSSIAGYVVEYGGMAGDPEVSLNAISTINLDAKPTTSYISNQTTDENVPLSVSFTVSDDLTPLDSLQVTASASDGVDSILISGTGTERKMVITPANNQSGEYSIVVQVSDGHSVALTTFKLNVIDTTQTLNIFGANGVPGETDAHTEFSLDGGETWQSAYLYGSHPWGVVPGTNSWINCAPSGQACLDMEVLYRIQFNVPDNASNAEMKFDIKADNYATISLNGTHVTDIEGQNSIDLDASIASEVQPGLNTILLNVKDVGGWAGLNYKITLTINAPTPPVLVDPSPTAKVNYSSMSPTNVDVVASIIPSETVTITNNGGSASYTFSENGSFTFEFVDSMGNTGEAVASVTNIDKVAPVITVGSYITTPTNQDVVVTVTTNEGTLNASEHTFTENGEFTFTTTDAAGNVTNKTVTITNIDKIAPVTIDDSHSEWQNEDMTVTLNASDNSSGVATTYYQVNGGDLQEGTSVELTEEGTNELIYWSVDVAGNIENKHSKTIRIDKSAPETKVSTNIEPNQNGWFNQDVTVILAATDELSGIEKTFYSIDGAEAQSGTSFIVSDEGNHVVTYWSVDNVGNGETAQTLVINMDTTAPTLNVTLDNAILWSPNHKLVEITALTQGTDDLSELESIVLTSITSNELDYDPSSVDDDVANDIQEAAFGENDTNFLLRSERSGEGTGRVYTITYTATDIAGNKTTITVVVEVPHDKGNNKEDAKGKRK